MKIYIDLLLFLNFAFDFILLLTVSIILKRRTPLKRIFLGSILGSLTILVLFIPFNTLMLFITKILLSIVIVSVTYGTKSINYILTNMLYFLLTSIILGGFMYYLSVEFSSTTDMSISYLFILLSSPIILYIYTKGMKKYKLKTTTFYNVDIYLKNKILKLTGFMDTGNTLLDPYKKRKVIITKNKEIKEYINENNFFLVPYESVSTHGLLKCIKVDKIYIESLGLKRNIVIGFTEDFKIDADCILNYLLMEE